VRGEPPHRKTVGPLNSRRDGWLMIAPLTTFLVILLAIPLAVDMVYAVSRVTFETLRAPSIVGLHNFAVVLRDGEFWGAMLFSLRFAVLVTAAELFLALALAIFLAPLLARLPWLMAPLLLPMMVAPALVGLMYRLVLHEFVGAVPYYFVLLTGDSPSFLGPDNVFRTLVTIETLQWTPFALLILYTAYQSIPADVREAAALDGPGPLQMLRYIELPLMLPTILAVGFIRFIDSFRVFDNVYTLTGAGAGGDTTTISIYIYEAFFRRNDIGVAVAASKILLAVAFAMLTLVLRWSGRQA
jgi:multiple sugar transport system permease protein